MFRYVYPIIVILFLLSSCQENESEEVYNFPEGAVGFHIETLQTRGTPVMGLQEVDEFRVIAYQYEGLWESIRNNGTAQLFMENVGITQSSPDVWSYSPLQYWPLTNQNISFFAYSPQAATGSTPNNNGLSIAYNATGGSPVITYTVPTTVEDQPDLLVCTTPLTDLNRISNSAGVDIPLQHALTCIDFKATGEGERIIGVKLSGVVGNGSLTLGEQTIDWNIDPDNTDYEFKAGVNLEPLDNNPSSILSNDGYLMMIPQTLTDKALLTLTIDGGSDPYEQTFSLNTVNNGVWLPGQFIEYRFAVTPTITILLSPEQLILSASAKSYSSFSVICPEEISDATWTVKTSTADWLEIYDNPSGSNDVPQIDKYTYSGQGTTQLFAYAPASNTSSARLISSILLEETTQSIEVSQLFQDEVYVPTYPQGGWAGSNIYWVEDATYPDGGYLTFDDKDVHTHEHYQGVYFMWGSLVALSPYNNAWTGGLWNGTNGQVIYIPNKDAGTNGGWNPSTNTGWGYIPRLGWSNSSNPAGGGSALSLANNSGQSYLIQNHNPQGNVGDICKYLTDKGWAPGAKEGRKWRMPTHVEFSIGNYEKIGTLPFPLLNSTDWIGHAIYPNGFRNTSGNGTPFFPTSGYRLSSATDGSIYNLTNYRPGEAFTYWSSSPDRIYGHGLDYVNGFSQPTSVQGFFQRYTGATVRCVLEGYK